ncbi:phosphatidylserine decarboxylase [Calycomorphotria hydatis]|uniref:Phosphatidylserine decarboxylase n=1 Tax=Calycomorphotria hydatis TaxID=2528027 RepID=A0A517T633_9PLAN|nr:phosphatidylserine decarboxylase [Calycomorphotria hydatis]QDT63818.1 phosphatidylserine decarboxylase [Calycomorphotria hydatis]
MSETDQSNPTPERLTLEPHDPTLWCIQPAGGWLLRVELWWFWLLRKFGVQQLFERADQWVLLGKRPERLFAGDAKWFVNQPENKLRKAIQQEHYKAPYLIWSNCIWGESELGVGAFTTFVYVLFSFQATHLIFRYSVGEFDPSASSAAMMRFQNNLQMLYWLSILLPLQALLIGGGTFAFIVYFFRDPNRTPPADPTALLSPADGKVVEVFHLDHHPFVDGPAVRVGIFLSLFDVHVQRFPLDGRVIGVSWHPGKKLNALREEAARENECIETRIEGNAAPYRRVVMRQIAGMIASKVVNTLQPGDELEPGERLGMIKFGSRCELIFPQSDDLELHVAMGTRVRAGETIIARYISEKNKI